MEETRRGGWGGAGWGQGRTLRGDMGGHWGDREGHGRDTPSNTKTHGRTLGGVLRVREGHLRGHKERHKEKHQGTGRDTGEDVRGTRRDTRGDTGGEHQGEKGEHWAQNRFRSSTPQPNASAPLLCPLSSPPAASGTSAQPSCVHGGGHKSQAVPFFGGTRNSL